MSKLEECEARVKAAKMREEAASVRVIATHNRERAKASLRQSANPLYDGQAEICTRNAAASNAFADKQLSSAARMEAEADLIEQGAVAADGDLTAKVKDLQEQLWRANWFSSVIFEIARGGMSEQELTSEMEGKTPQEIDDYLLDLQDIFDGASYFDELDIEAVRQKLGVEEDV